MRQTRQQLRASERLEEKEQSSLDKMKVLGKLRSRRKDSSSDGSAGEKNPLQQIFLIAKFIVRILGWQYFVVSSRKKKEIRRQ
jgi:hypothetical protein